MISLNEGCDPRVHEMARAIARRTRFVIQAVLREEEWGDFEYEAYIIARDEIEKAERSRRSLPSSE